MTCRIKLRHRSGADHEPLNLSNAAVAAEASWTARYQRQRSFMRDFCDQRLRQYVANERSRDCICQLGGGAPGRTRRRRSQPLVGDRCRLASSRQRDKSAGRLCFLHRSQRVSDDGLCLHSRRFADSADNRAPGQANATRPTDDLCKDRAPAQRRARAANGAFKAASARPNHRDGDGFER